MSFNHWLQNVRFTLLLDRGQSDRRRPGSPRALGHEPLEDRCLLAFTPAASLPVDPYPVDVATADFDNDGRLDLVTANSGGGVNVLLGNADGTFQSPVTSHWVGPAPVALDVGDFNADGNLDLALATDGYEDPSGYIVGSILLGRGDGTFADAIPLSVSSLPPSSWSNSVAAGDLNADGKPDLVVTSSAFDDWTESLDGYVSVLLGNGDGNFTFAATYGPSYGDYSTPALADVDADGNIDVVVGRWSPAPGEVFLGNGDGTLSEPGVLDTEHVPSSIVVRDFNGDGKNDLAATSLLAINGVASSVGSLLGNGDATFRTVQSLPVHGEPIDAAAGEFNGDGILDLVVVDLLGSVSVLLGIGDGSFAAPIATAAGSRLGPVVVGDFNADGRLDAAVVDADWADTHRILVLFNDGAWSEQNEPEVRIDDANITEGNRGSSDAVFAVTLSQPSADYVSVDYATADGAATNGSDYLSQSGTVTFAAGETTKTIIISVMADKTKEADETFFVNLVGAMNATITDGQGVGTILNDDGQPKRMNRHDAALMALNFGRMTDATLEDGDLTDDGRVDLADLAYLQTQLDGSAPSPAMSASAAIASTVRQRAVDIPVTTRQTSNATLRAHARKAAAIADRGFERASTVAMPSSATLDSLALRAARLRRAFAG